MCSQVVRVYFPCLHPQDKIAEWAVKKYNDEGHHLTLLRMLDCEQLPVGNGGTYYRLLLKCRDEDNHENHYYQTVVNDNPEEKLRVLVSFVRLCQCPSPL
ncbi:cysteine proteinase inhibitor 5-like [Cucumis melo var. makuwa]|uniref:Cysteine proteinase inhibitor 5-like n=1 Tax=Cucumis melo var. makuwa TaxID=1194695 RepID=A0A5A7UN92_CUCMM|nr:cysteine proteinase inhibitor 5-like [Cucumis melo var. makuwa]